MTGTFSDPSDDIVTLSADIGTVVDEGDGTWSWTWQTADGPDESQVVEIVATDDDNGQGSVSIDVTVQNVAPEITTNESQLQVLTDGTAMNSGAYADFGADTVTLSTSLGVLTDNLDGTWDWSIDTVGLSSPQTIEITATDSDDAANMATFELVISSIIAHEVIVTVDEGIMAVNQGSYIVPGMGDAALIGIDRNCR